MATAKEVKRGGLSDEVFYSAAMREYLEERETASGGVAFGYIGDNFRNANKDKLVEAALRSLGLSNDEIAQVLASSIGRHMADDLASFTSNDKVMIKAVAGSFVRRYRGDIGKLINREIDSDEAAKRLKSIKSQAAILIAEAAKLEASAYSDPTATNRLRAIDVALDSIVVASF